MADKHPDYWKLKAIALEAQLARERAQQAIARQTQAFAAAGLDPSVNYELRDDDETITAKTA